MLMMVGSYVMSFCCLSSGAQPHLVAFASCWNIPWPMETCHAYASPSVLSCRVWAEDPAVENDEGSSTG